MRRVFGLSACSMLMATSIGCRTPSARLNEFTASQPGLENPPDFADVDPGELPASDATVTSVSFEESTADTAAELEAAQPTALRSEGVLSLGLFVAEVQAVHPSVAAMYSAWQAAAQRYPQAISLDDPMFGTTLAPASFGSDDVESAYALEASQKIPWHGKRALR